MKYDQPGFLKGFEWPIEFNGQKNHGLHDILGGMLGEKPVAMYGQAQIWSMVYATWDDCLNSPSPRKRPSMGWS